MSPLPFSVTIVVFLRHLRWRVHRVHVLERSFLRSAMFLQGSKILALFLLSSYVLPSNSLFAGSISGPLPDLQYSVKPPRVHLDREQPALLRRGQGQQQDSPISQNDASTPPAHSGDHHDSRQKSKASTDSSHDSHKGTLSPSKAWRMTSAEIDELLGPLQHISSAEPSRVLTRQSSPEVPQQENAYNLRRKRMYVPDSQTCPMTLKQPYGPNIRQATYRI